MIPENSSYIGADKHRSTYQADSGLSIKMYEERLNKLLCEGEFQRA